MLLLQRTMMLQMPQTAFVGCWPLGSMREESCGLPSWACRWMPGLETSWLFSRASFSMVTGPTRVEGIHLFCSPIIIFFLSRCNMILNHSCSLLDSLPVSRFVSFLLHCAPNSLRFCLVALSLHRAPTSSRSHFVALPLCRTPALSHSHFVHAPASSPSHFLSIFPASCHFLSFPLALNVSNVLVTQSCCVSVVCLLLCERVMCVCHIYQHNSSIQAS